MAGVSEGSSEEYVAFEVDEVIGNFTEVEIDPSVYTDEDLDAEALGNSPKRSYYVIDRTYYYRDG
jgi:hypothetical protein